MIAIIPARGGSKRIPKKNIRNFLGKPMIQRSIQAATEIGIFDRIIVSTDDHEVADVAIAAGAEVPFFRPDNLSDDYTPTLPVIRHAISECSDRGITSPYYCCIYPCAPFLRGVDVTGALDELKRSEAKFSYPVAEYPHPPQRALRRADSGMLQFVAQDKEMSRTQDLQKLYFDTGQFYWGAKESWVSFDNMHSLGYGYIVPGWRVVDIDTEDDWLRAEITFQLLEKIETDVKQKK